MLQELSSHKNALKEEYFNAASHAIAAVASFVGFVFLIVYAGTDNKAWSLFSSLIYGISLLSVYVSSTLYHTVREVRLKRTLRKVDHACIYLLIAGTYTPLLLMEIGGSAGWTLFGIQWTLAFFGIIMKVFYFDEFKKFSLLLYAVMGWIAIFKLHDLYLAVPSVAFILILLGGIVYTLGIIFFVLDGKLPYAHFIWHLFVIVGSLMHYLAIFLYVI